MAWQFDKQVAEVFVDHARQHIPNYDQVIDKCVSLCERYLDHDSRIIDVGCATGETLNRLHQSGFENLTGVDSSAPMLDHCNHAVANIIHSDTFPKHLEKFDAVLCNWTLHFVRDKFSYLLDIYQSLAPGGFLVVSDKTSLDPVMISLYHDWKQHQGVSPADISAKALAVQDIMFINSAGWYLDTLSQLGFNDVQIIDASWCFTSFLAVKSQLDLHIG